MRGLVLKKNAGALRGREGKERMQMRIRKVAIYARVSTEHEAQLSALENQVQYYDVYFTKLTVTPDDERAWFKMHPQWSKSNKYAELEAWIYI